MKAVAIFSLIVSIVYILILSLHPTYYMHLYPDVFVFHDRASYFFNHLNLTELGHNEYQPGAMLFFIALSPINLIDNSLESFKWALFSANIGFICLIAYILYKWGKTSGILLLSLLMVFLGPITLFRFDLLTILLLILAFFLWEKQKPTLSMATLAFATIVKVYPVIFLPYLLYLYIKKEKGISFLYPLSVFISSFLIYLFGYTLLFQISLFDTYTSYNFHNLKSVGTESVWATFLFLFQLFQSGTLPAIEGAYGINAIARSKLTFPIWFFNYFWIIPLFVIHIWYLLKKQKENGIDYEFILLNLLLFLVFSKVLSNQYLAWFLFVIPLLDYKRFTSPFWITNLFLIILTTILHTYIFPLQYTAWLEIFTRNNYDPFLFSIGIFSNIILVIILGRLIYEVLIKKVR